MLNYVKTMSLGFVWPRLPLGVETVPTRYPGPTHSPGMPGPPELRPAVGWRYIPSSYTTCSLRRVQVVESVQAKGTSHSSSRKGPCSLRSRSSQLFSWDS